MFVIVAPNHLARRLQFDSTCMRVYQSCISPADKFELTNTSVVAGLNQQVCFLPNQRTGKHSCTRPAGTHVTLATEQQPCLYKLHTISIYVCYSFILISESMYICTRPSAMSVTIASDVMSFTVALSVKLAPTSVGSEALAPDQNSYLL